MSREIPPPSGDEQTLLATFLDWYRATPAVKCDGLTEEQAHRRALPSSPSMSMAGLINHLRWVEFIWFEHRLLGHPDISPLRKGDAPDPEFAVGDRTLAELLAEYEEQCARSRKAVEGLSLDTPTALPVLGGTPVSLRWVLLHLIEETARHAGHLDVMRELLDGTRGV
ncbi:DinB family protein [Actinocorallia sp. B10E7]|uniref:DinB family protein n=1 Tax=Actinocorallia sp. B10E7 TaxID=3153558 RepID=UPI00325E36BD